MSKHTYKTVFETLLLSSGWAKNVEIEVDSAGLVSGICCLKRLPQGAVSGLAIPALPNAHGHAFQRAFAGFAEKKSANDFWLWRKILYQSIEKITPSKLKDIASWLYVEMLKSGYGAICEFHYLHHRFDGRRWPSVTAMTDSLVEAALIAGADLTLFPVLYQRGDFNTKRVLGAQRAFFNTLDNFHLFLDIVKNKYLSIQHGVALHSLRAVSEEVIQNAIEIFPHGPLHIHIAEQTQEVDNCLRTHGCRPVEWLLNNASLNSRWSLIHATHTTSSELKALARKNVNVVLCPTTEANLADGMFSLADHLLAGGNIAIGSDSHVSVDPREELRLLEYGQRLTTHRRAVATTARKPHPGANLWKRAVKGGLRSLGLSVEGLEVGAPANIAVLDLDSPVLVGKKGDAALDAFVFCGQPSPVRDVMARGRWVVRNFAHMNEQQLKDRYLRALHGL